jgi:hypothetical protein
MSVLNVPSVESSASTAARSRVRYSRSNFSSESTSLLSASRREPRSMTSASSRARSDSWIRRAVASAWSMMRRDFASDSSSSCRARLWASATASSAAFCASTSVRLRMSSVSVAGSPGGRASACASFSVS